MLSPGSVLVSTPVDMLVLLDELVVTAVLVLALVLDEPDASVPLVEGAPVVASVVVSSRGTSEPHAQLIATRTRRRGGDIPSSLPRPRRRVRPARR